MASEEYAAGAPSWAYGAIVAFVVVFGGTVAWPHLFDNDAPPEARPRASAPELARVHAPPPSETEEALDDPVVPEREPSPSAIGPQPVPELAEPTEQPVVVEPPEPEPEAEPEPEPEIEPAAVALPEPEPPEPPAAQPELPDVGVAAELPGVSDRIAGLDASQRAYRGSEERVRGLAALQAGQLAEAEASFRRSLMFEPNSLETTRAMFRTRLAQRRSGAAYGWLRRALELAPSDALLWILVGDTLQRLHHRDVALTAWEHALRLAPDNFGAAQRVERARAASSSSE